MQGSFYEDVDPAALDKSKKPHRVGEWLSKFWYIKFKNEPRAGILVYIERLGLEDCSFSLHGMLNTNC